MKTGITEGNRCPLYTIGKSGDYLCNIPGDKLDWIKNTMEKFEKVQAYLGRLYKVEQERQGKNLVKVDETSVVAAINIEDKKE